MNKTVLVMAVALMAAAMLIVSVNTALAVTVYTDYQSGGGNSVVDVPGQTMIRLRASHFDESDYYFGKADRIQIDVHTGQFTPAGLPIFKAVAAYEDNPTRNAFSIGLGTGQVQNLVEPGQIQVLRVGKSNTVMVHWNIPLVAPATTTTPEVTLPPGMLVLRGYGEPFSSHLSGPIGSTGWSYSFDGTVYSAEATLFCKGWNYKWLPVGENYAETSLVSRSVPDATWTWTHP